MPATALQHFTEDIARAEAIRFHASSLPTSNAAEQLLRSDLLRSSWMFAVGALDAYFCDAYTDVVAAAVSSKSRQPAIGLPDWFYDIKFPIRAILEEYDNPNWRWRMAARKMMERENVLSLGAIQNLFNKFFREDQRFFKSPVLDTWIRHANARFRVFGIRRAAYQALNKPGQEKEQETARKKAREHLESRFKDIFQRRHDCIHNCDRPRMLPQPLTTASTVLKVIEDIDFLVQRCDEHITVEFRQFLADCGCNAATIAAARY